MKRNQKWLTLAALLIVACVFAGCMPAIRTSYYANADEYMSGNFAYFAEDIQKIQIHWYSGEIKFVQSDSQILSVTENSDSLKDKEKLHWFVDEGVLRIEYCAASYSSRIPSGQKHLVVEVPAGIDLVVNNSSANITLGSHQLNSVDIYSISGNIYINSLTVKKADIGSISGAIRSGAITAEESVQLLTTSGIMDFQTIRAKTLSVSSVSGSISTGTVAVTQDAQIETVSGAIKAEQMEVNKAKISSTSGAIKIGVVNCGSVDMKTDSGEVSIALIDGMGATVAYRTTSGKFSAQEYKVSAENYIFGDGSCQIDVETVSGGVKVE